ncbi:uncharacterized membrane protein YoaK (UPF0700 family) [Shinella granuli]|uniref:Uncharacterized membrane protein YoaK (UPF0700 family) n=2 Tax=Rhizobiaceae TaxID=82115 RepID=A0A4R2BYM4_SHIGR|nr:uncharacterized membrane protein YoaK (UPF0700 family) [Shinella granuli]
MHRYFMRLADRDRSEEADTHLAYLLAFVAGGANAGGFMVVHQYTSHMSGIVSGMADSLVLGQIDIAVLGAGSLVAFVCGAATSAFAVNWARRRGLRSVYALPLAWEGILLLLFSIISSQAQQNTTHFTIQVILLLCYVMGLQNAVITKLSGARIRTTHVTGMVTDLGIEIGKLIYLNRDSTSEVHPRVRADRRKIRVLAQLIGQFFFGGLIGAWLFKTVGLPATLAFALPLLGISASPLICDIKNRSR